MMMMMKSAWLWLLIFGLIVTVRTPTAGAARKNRSEERGSREGIAVHGHWTIVVRNPDGSIASHHEFENALVQGKGDLLLALLLSRNAVAGYWIVQLGGTPTAHYGTSGIVVPGNACLISEVSTLPAQGCKFTDVLTTQGPQLEMVSPPTTVTLTGSGKYSAAASIDAVTAYNGPCLGGETASACGAGPQNIVSSRGHTYSALIPFTSQTLSTPISVQAGQSVDVIVVLSFS